MHVTVRRIAEGDGPVLREIRLEAILDSPSAFARTHAEESAYGSELWAERARRGAAGAESAYFFAEAGERLVGLVGGFRSPESVNPNLVSMWVSPEARGHSAATLLAEAVIEWAASSGYAALDLWVVTENARAIAFYRRLGFVEVGEVGVLASDETKQEMKMRRSLIS